MVLVQQIKNDICWLLKLIINFDILVIKINY